MFDQITILGPGLLGASLALAIKEKALSRRITTWSRRAETREKSKRQSWCDAVFDCPESAAKGSDLIVICTPVETIPEIVAQIRPALRPQCLITDVGSTKAHICHQASELLKGYKAHFIGSHPMAGSEQCGLENAKPDLFKQAACIVTPDADTPAELVDRIQRFWTAIGMHITVATAQEHDAIVAHISHLPHLLASTLCSYLAKQPSQWQHLSGGGLRDSTRIASGDPDLWRQILRQNKTEVLSALNGLEDELKSFRAALTDETPDAITQLLSRGKTYRDELRNTAPDA